MASKYFHRVDVLILQQGMVTMLGKAFSKLCLIVIVGCDKVCHGVIGMLRDIRDEILICRRQFRKCEGSHGLKHYAISNMGIENQERGDTEVGSARL